MRARIALIATAALLGVTAPASAKKKEAHFQSYGGYATTDLVVIRGRVARGAPIADKPWRGGARRVLATARSFLGRDVEHARLRVVHAGISSPARADDEGFFEARLAGKFAAGRQQFELLLDEPRYSAPPLAVELQVVDGTQGLVVVSDIDDTLIATGVTGGKLDLVAKIASSDARDIVPYAGAAEALQAFAAEGVPIVYLSASPVELAPRLMQFFQLRNFPPGMLFLRHYESHGIGDPTTYKRRRFAQVLKDFPGRKLVVFGDDGEKDLEIFDTLATSTGRVQAAYARRTVHRAAPVTVITFDEWSEVVEHARATGLLKRR